MAKEQTRQAIVRAFLDQLNVRPVDKISIKDIVTACGISRNTFYYHYRDIYALLSDIFEQEAQRILEDTAQEGTWQEALIVCTQFAMDNRRAIYHIYNSINRDALERYLFRVSDMLMERMVRHYAGDLPVDDQDVRYITVFYKHAVVGIVVEWIQNDMRIHPEAAIRRLGQIFEGNIRASLERAVNVPK